MKNNALLFVGQKAFIEKDGKVLILICPNGWLDFPGGKLQEGEAQDGDVASLQESLKAIFYCSSILNLSNFSG